MSSARTTLRVFALAAFIALLHFAALGALMVTGVGPFGRGLRLMASGTDTYSEATAQAWFDTAEQFVAFDRFILWPAVFLLASVLAVRCIPGWRWWHSLLIACAILPMSLPVHTSPIPDSSKLMPWLDLLVELLAYALLVVFISQVVRYLHTRRASSSAAA